MSYAKKCEAKFKRIAKLNAAIDSNTNAPEARKALKRNAYKPKQPTALAIARRASIAPPVVHNPGLTAPSLKLMVHIIERDDCISHAQLRAIREVREVRISAHNDYLVTTLLTYEELLGAIWN
jgi:hypothetical protein